MTDIDNALIRQDDQIQKQGPSALDQANKKKEKKAEPPPPFDADARNRFEFTVREGVKKYETAHVFGPLTDERYMKWLRDFKIRGNDDDVSEEAREASVALWDDVITEVEKIQYPEG